HAEIAIFLTLAVGYYFGKFNYKGLGLGAVTATLLAGVLIGQIGITISQPLKAFSFLMCLFAVGYAVGPQFVRGVAKDGVPQAIFSVVQCVLCLASAVVTCKFAGYDVGYSAGLYSGSQTISAAMGLSTDAINRLGLPADQAKALLDSRLFIQRIRRNGAIEDASADTILQEGDVVAVVGARDVLVNVLGTQAEEVNDPELLDVPVLGVDVLVTSKAVDGKTLTEIAGMPGARGAFLRKITRGATATTIPILPNTKIQRGDLLTLVGRTADVNAATKMLGVADKATDITD